MMIHLSDEEHELYVEMKQTNDPKKIAEIRAKLKEIWDKKAKEQEYNL